MAQRGLGTGTLTMKSARPGAIINSIGGPRDGSEMAPRWLKLLSKSCQNGTARPPDGDPDNRMPGEGAV